MQKPDAEGYVHITWPSKSIPHGGIFHPRRAEPSKDRQEFLKVLLEESKMDIALRKKSGYRLRREEEKPAPSVSMRMPVVRPRTSKRRSLSTIKESGIYELDDYRPPKRGEDREKAKDRLAFAMVHGEFPSDIKPEPAPIGKPAPKLPTAKEKWHDLVTQIRERVDWLAEMEELGQAEPHRDIIQDQIAERLRALDALGVDSECVSVRSGFSTLRSREPEPEYSTRSSIRSGASVKSNGNGKGKASAKSDKIVKGSAKPGLPETRKSTATQDKPIAEISSAKRSVTRKREQEENVSQYERCLAPLRYSPRRRV